MLQGLMVDVTEDRVVPLRVFNISNEVFHLAAETVIALAKPVTDVTSLELNQENHDGAMGQARVINEHVTRSSRYDSAEGLAGTT